MSTAQHTPGPWTIERGWNGDGIAVTAPTSRTSLNNERGLIAETTHTPFEQQQPANARLIAAAPELLEALQAAWEHLQYCGYGDRWERDCAKSVGLDAQIRAAIAKATGGEQ